MDTINGILIVFLLAILYIMPIILFAIKYRPFQNFTFNRLAATVTGAVAVYVFISLMFLMLLLGNEKLIEDPDYIDINDSIVTVSVIFFFWMSQIFFFVPLTLLLNLIRLILKITHKP